MKKTVILTALMASTTGAFADDLPFDGGYLGAEAGYLKEDFDHGTYYGAYVGWRRQMDGGMVLGLEGSFGKTNLGAVFDEADSEDFYESQWAVMATAGYASGRNLFSLGGGYAKVNSTYVYNGTDNDAGYDGVAAMAGYERAIGDTVSLRIRTTTYKFDTVIYSAGIGIRF